MHDQFDLHAAPATRNDLISGETSACVSGWSRTEPTGEDDTEQGPCLNIKAIFPMYEIPMLTIRPPRYAA